VRVPWSTPGFRRRNGPRAARRDRGSARLHAEQLHAFIRQEGMEQPDGIAAAADAGDERVRHASLGGEDLLPRLVPITDWKSRTIDGYGCGPRTDPRT
jgi:hypothetical protein